MKCQGKVKMSQYKLTKKGKNILFGLIVVSVVGFSAITLKNIPSSLKDNLKNPTNVQKSTTNNNRDITAITTRTSLLAIDNDNKTLKKTYNSHEHATTGSQIDNQQSTFLSINQKEDKSDLYHALKTIYFHEGETTLNDKEKNVLDDFITWALLYPDEPIIIEGHGIKTKRDGWGYRNAEKRAGVVYRYLTLNGVAKKRLTIHIEISSQSDYSLKERYIAYSVMLYFNHYRPDYK